jgi:hypothetical protein
MPRFLAIALAADSQLNGDLAKLGTMWIRRTRRVNRVRQIRVDERIST